MLPNDLTPPDALVPIAPIVSIADPPTFDVVVTNCDRPTSVKAGQTFPNFLDPVSMKPGPARV